MDKRLGGSPRIHLSELMRTLKDIKRSNDDGAAVSFARLFSKHGHGTPAAISYAKRYADNANKG
jgi:hypothetical protein